MAEEQTISLPKAHDVVTEDFKYRSLNDKEFRTLELHPGSGLDELMCSLTPRQLGQGGFTAVSYCWGSTERSQIIQCGDAVPVPPDSKSSYVVAKEATGIIRITSNLRNFLLGIRDDEFYRTLWVDSICINQDDVEEKTAQVKMMANIYDFSPSTLVYLGSSDDGTIPAFMCATALAAMKDWPPEKVPKFLPKFGSQQSPFAASEDDGARMDPWEAFVLLLDREWFRRIWIFQEIVLSRAVTIICGDFHISWDVLVDACKVVLKYKMYELDHMTQRCGAVQTIENRRLGYSECRRQIRENSSCEMDGMTEFVHDMNLGMLQIWTRHFRATDPRDKVFALMNICLPHHSLDSNMPPIDYGMSLPEVYCRTARYWFLSQPSRPLQFLTCVDNPEEVEDLPSWIPDWRNKWSGEPLSMINHKGAARDRKSVAIFHDIPSPFRLPLRLTVRGVTLMQVKETERIKLPEGWETARHSVMLNEFGGSYPTTIHSYREAFQKAIAPKTPEDFQPVIERPFTYWRYEIARQNGTALRPASLPLADGKLGYVTMHLPADVVSTLDQKNNIEYTQSMLYDVLPWYCRNKAVVPQQSMIDGRSFFISTNGFMGLVPKRTQAGDIICLFFGLASPVVLRKKDGDVWQYIGECYVYGLMGGEGLEDMPLNLIQDFVLE